MGKTTLNPVRSLFAGLSRYPSGPFSGVNGALTSLLLAHLALEPGIRIAAVPTSERALELLEETRAWLGTNGHRMHGFLPERKSVYDQTSIDPAVSNARLAALGLGIAGGGLIILPFATLFERFHQPGQWKKAGFKVTSGGTHTREQCIQQLAQLGYTRARLVEEPRQFSVRGSLLDVFPPNSEFPVRLDFFGDELETVKTFSPETQRTLEKIPEIIFFPAFEHFLPPKEAEDLVESIHSRARELAPTRQELLQRRLDRLISNPVNHDFRELLPFFRPVKGFLWEFWENPKLFLENPDQFRECAEEFFNGQMTGYEKLGDLTPLPPPDEYYHDPRALFDGIQKLEFSGFERFKNPRDCGLIFDVSPLPPPADPSRESLIKDLKRWISEGYAVVIAIGDHQRYHSLKGLLGERRFPIRASPNPLDAQPGAILILQAPIRRGFIARAEKLVILCEDDLYQHARSDAGTVKASASHSWSISQLIPGDIVVHADHGVAEYRGIQTLTAGGNTRDYLLLQYSGSDKLYVPTDQVHKVQKYIGMEGVRPAIHSLNSKVWDNQKRRVKKNVESIAKELLELYAKRRANPGFAFLPDNELQRDMEARFSYIETPDQAKAIEAVKSDMETTTPMDRIVCGDVGYGKTEVAIRAAFKAVCSGKQTAILAPTTLLAFQHHQTFISRLEGLPVRVGMVSRLISPAEAKALLEKVKSGVVDILIGTHRILSGDVKFKDLGLLIIDEEQRFGVKHKERFKEMRETLDVLTLSATPIPRTLHMALSGIRQISVIDTPPVDRRPIHTYVAPHDPTWSKRAIIEEMKRGGQVYYVYNRVEKIDQKAAQIRLLVPEARIAVAHGQMDEHLVEKTMLSFIRREFDVLVATTIIESGLDIPNVNTLIVDEAERLGLSQMYQLRGRVGRSARQAWAYFFYSKGRRLTPEAYERLSTIEEHTALGSGFRIALRDLQIRGAGNLLGREQSGHIAAVGFALYIELLEEAVARLRGAAPPKPPESVIEIPVTALFPAKYIDEEDTRIDMYARLAKCDNLDTLELLRIECEDRFGAVPDEAMRLFHVAKLRILASKCGVMKITQQYGRLRFEFDAGRLPEPERVIDARVAYFKRLSMFPDDPNSLQLSLQDIDLATVLPFTEKFLRYLGNPA